MTKPIVHYEGKAQRVGDRALLAALDHPQFPPKSYIRTSRIVKWSTIGRIEIIETLNTIYMPRLTPQMPQPVKETSHVE